MQARDLDIDYERDSEEHRAHAAGDWENNGPILRNRPPGHVHSHYWTMLESLIWVATRDERAIAGAAGYLRDRQSLQQPVDYRGPAIVIVSTDLRIDVSGHHLDCPAMWERAPCKCADLGRMRYCVCDPKDQSLPDWTCKCVDTAKRDLERSILDGLPLAGKAEGAAAWTAINTAALAGARRGFDRSGMSFVPGYTDLRLRIEDVKERWPSDFSEMSTRIVTSSPQAAALAPLKSVVLPGRPPDWLWGLKVFCDRLNAGKVRHDRLAEAGEIAPNLVLREGRSSAASPKTIAGWIGEYHDQLTWNGAVATNGDDVARKVVAVMSDAVAKKLARKP